MTHTHTDTHVNLLSLSMGIQDIYHLKSWQHVGQVVTGKSPDHHEEDHESFGNGSASGDDCSLGHTTSSGGFGLHKCCHMLPPFDFDQQPFKATIFCSKVPLVKMH